MPVSSQWPGAHLPSLQSGLALASRTHHFPIRLDRICLPSTVTIRYRGGAGDNPVSVHELGIHNGSETAKVMG